LRVAIGTDHAGFVLKQRLVRELEALGHQVVDHGAHAEQPPVDYPDFCFPVAEQLARGEVERGVVLGGSGIGEAIAANKVDGIRAALCADAATADGARRWNDANVLALSLRTTSEAVLGEILDAWFAASPSPDADDAANVAHIAEIDHERGGPRVSPPRANTRKGTRPPGPAFP